MEKSLKTVGYRSNVLLGTASSIAVVIIFHICYGLQALVPENVNWLMSAMHDWGGHHLAWHFYKNEPWQFPLGDVTEYYYPLGTNVGFTDSIPLLAIFFKIFAFALPEDFQYFGMWLFACHLLIAYYTVRLLKLFSVPSPVIFLAVILVAANPVLVYRGMHPALCGHWLLIGSLFNYFRDPVMVKPSRILGHQFVLTLLAALINPYLCFMVLGFSLILSIKLAFSEKVISKKRLITYLLTIGVSLLAVWYIVGMVNFTKKTDLGVQGGFGLYGMNLNSFYNAQGYSRYLPSFKHVSWHQYEGFMYLGFGGILLVLMALACYILQLRSRDRDSKPHAPKKMNRLLPLAILAALYALFSITHMVTLNDRVLFSVPLPKVIIKFGEIFRASSRFFWAIYYLILVATFVTISRSRINNYIKYAIIIVAITLQISDTWPLLNSRKFAYGSYTPPVDHKAWELLIDQFDEVNFYPPFQASYVSSMDYQFFCYLAAKAKKRINTGYVPRFDNTAAARYTDSLQGQIGDGNLSARTLYITSAAYLPNFTYPFQSGISALNTLDKYYYFFANKTVPTDVVSLAAKLNKKDIAAFEEGTKILGQKNVFMETSSVQPSEKKAISYQFGKLNNRDAYLSIGGWAFLDSTASIDGDSIFLTLSNKNKFYIASTNSFQRPDLVTHFKRSDLINAGFNALVFKDNVETGEYALGILIKKKNGQTTHQITDITSKASQAKSSSVQRFENNLPQVQMNFGVDKLDISNQFISIGGWAAIVNQGMENCTIKIILKNGDETYLANTMQVRRPDVTATVGKASLNLDNSGFNASVPRNSLPNGTYQLGIIIKNNKTGAEGLSMTDKTVEVK